MRDPQEALAAARAAAAGQAEPEPVDADAEWELEASLASTRRLAQWAIIEPESARIYSTRRLGAPITWCKRLLVRLLAQYLGQMAAQQSRFNASLAAHVIQLEERVGALERAAAAREPEQPGDR